MRSSLLDVTRFAMSCGSISKPVRNQKDQGIPRADEMVGSIFLNRASHRAMMRLWHLVVSPSSLADNLFPLLASAGQ